MSPLQTNPAVSKDHKLQVGDETGGEEPNFVIYNLIKEIDYLVENTNYLTS